MKFNCREDNATSRAAAVRLLLLDVDGVLTDGRLYYSNSGEEMKAFSTLDGHGIKSLQKAGVAVGIITGRRSILVARRAQELGIELLVQGCNDKLAALEDVLRDRELPASEVAYVGDDFPDLPVLRRAGFSVSVPQGHPDVRSRVHAVTSAPGGFGAVREVTDFILQAQEQYTPLLED